jgi:C4-dicarboxylate-binding protein DctP
LYKDKEELEALQLGAVQMLAPSLAKFAPLGAKEFEVFDFPCIFPQLYRPAQSHAGPAWQTTARQSWIPRASPGWPIGTTASRFVSSNKPIKSGGRLQGARNCGFSPPRCWMRRCARSGAIPQVHGLSPRSYQALANRRCGRHRESTVQHVHAENARGAEVRRCVTNHGYLGYAVVVNKKFWEGLPADIRGALSKAMTESTKVANDVALQDNKDALEKVRASGKTTIYNPSMAERFLLKKALIPVHKQMASRIGDETIQAIYKETSFDPSKL